MWQMMDGQIFQQNKIKFEVKKLNIEIKYLYKKLINYYLIL